MNLEQPRLYRYEYYSRFKKMFLKKNIIFPSPLSWPDLFEQRFLSNSFLKYCFGYKKDFKNLRNDIFALCYTGDGTENADAQWNTRNPKRKDFCIKYSINLWKMLDYLNLLSDNIFNGKIEFYISSISYEYSQEELIQNQHIRAIGKPSGDNRVPYLIRTMSYKRKAFKYENEIRIWAVLKEDNPLSEKNNHILTLENFDWKKIDLQIQVAPYKSILAFDKFKKLKDYNQAKRINEKNIQQERTTKILNELRLLKKEINVSHLYNIPVWKCSKDLK